MAITKISIRNFRSIKNQVFSPKDLSIIVGPNDVGKSNYLRALNLFFNGQTDPGKDFSFQDDFSIYAEKRKQKADEIVIEISFIPPKTFKDNKEVTWRKTWRTGGQRENTRYYSSSKDAEISKRGKVDSWLDKIQFKYVPAIKSPDYFRSLMRDLHDTLASTIDKEMRSASGDFIEKIRAQTAALSENLRNRLNLESLLQLPSDLGTIFEALDFQTSATSRNISLQRRGDGIKVRHIPAMLKFVAEQQNVINGRGAIKSFTIWGYEEPENNMELSKAFDLADEFLEYSSDIQILITTHSPAFYSLLNNKEKLITAFIAAAGPTQDTTLTEINDENVASLDMDLGLMQLVEPYIRDIHDKYIDLQKKINQIKPELPSQPTVFVEGVTDKKLLDDACEIFGYDNLNIVTSSGAGAQWVKDRLVAALATIPDTPIVGVFDGDESGREAKDDFSKIRQQFYSKRTVSVSAESLEPSQDIIAIRTLGVVIPISIEELFPAKTWRTLEINGWLEQRDTVIKDNIKLLQSNLDQSLPDAIREKGLTEDQSLMVMKKVGRIHKNSVTKYVLSLPLQEREEVYLGFHRTIEKLRKFFSDKQLRLPLAE